MPETITRDEIALMDAMFAAADRKKDKRLARQGSAPPDRPFDFPRETECVYVVGDSDQCIVKIGWSTNLRTRLADLRCTSAFPVTVLWATPGGRELEDALHRRFDDQRFKGEWFDFPDGDAVAQVKKAVEILHGGIA